MSRVHDRDHFEYVHPGRGQVGALGDAACWSQLVYVARETPWWSAPKLVSAGIRISRST